MMQRFVALKVKCMEMYGSPCTHAKISKRLSKIRDFSSKNLKLATLLMFYAQSLNSLRSNAMDANKCFSRERKQRVIGPV